MRANYEQARLQMIAAAFITQQEFDKDMLRLDDPGFLMPSRILRTVCVRRAK